MTPHMFAMSQDKIQLSLSFGHRFFGHGGFDWSVLVGLFSFHVFWSVCLSVLFFSRGFNLWQGRGSFPKGRLLGEV